MRGKEESKSGKKRKQQVKDQLLPSLTKKTVESSLVSSQRSGPKELDSSGIQAYAARFGKLSRKSLLLPGERVFHLLHVRK
jgi:hypothetical protein